MDTGASVKIVTVVQGETSVPWVKTVGMEQGAQASVLNWMGEGSGEP